MKTGNQWSKFYHDSKHGKLRRHLDSGYVPCGSCVGTGKEIVLGAPRHYVSKRCKRCNGMGVLLGPR